MREKDPFQKIKVPSYKNIEKKESPENKGNTQDIKQKLLNLDSNVKSASLEDLRNMVKDFRKLCQEQHQEMTVCQKKLRMETFKNQKYKSDVQEYDKKCEAIRVMLANRLINQYKGNKDSPLFYNETGLSPFQLLLLHYSRNDTYSQNICMICYMDIQLNSQIVHLPCSHIMHRECATQHLLYSKQCPGCSQEIVFNQPQPKFQKT